MDFVNHRAQVRLRARAVAPMLRLRDVTARRPSSDACELPVHICASIAVQCGFPVKALVHSSVQVALVDLAFLSAMGQLLRS